MVFIHDGKEGHLLHRVRSALPIIAATVSPKGHRLCILQAQAHATSRLATLVAYNLREDDTGEFNPDSSIYRPLWRKSDIPRGLHSGLLATDRYCAALLPTPQAQMPKPFFYRAYAWRSSAPLFDSEPMHWQHRRPEALQFMGDGTAILALLSNAGAVRRGSRYLAELLPQGNLRPKIAVGVDCAMVRDGALHLKGGTVDARHFRWIQGKSGFPVVGHSTACEGRKARSLSPYSPAARRGLLMTRDRGAPKTLEFVHSVQGRVLRTLARSRGPGLSARPDHSHLRGSTLLLADDRAVYQIDLENHSAQRFPARLVPDSTPPFFGPAGTIHLLQKHTKHYDRLFGLGPKGQFKEAPKLIAYSQSRPRPDGVGYRFVSKNLPLRPTDAQWIKDGERWLLLAYEPLAGVFLIDPERKRIVRRCCKRPMGEGGVFGLSVAPDGRQAAVIATGKRPSLHLLFLPSLKPADTPIALPHRRNDYAKIHWLTPQDLVVIRDARFVQGRPTSTFFSLRHNRSKEIAFEDRGPVFYAAKERRFYQLLAGGRGAKIFDGQGRLRLIVGLANGEVFFVDPNGRHGCGKKSCAVFRCTFKGKSVPAQSCHWPRF
ncbi:MAG: hypothetical protein JRH20_11405 [Deltaproteobacteria bacterium]|nr:hypothetical protein [Deltaproteobacteria bacterium]